MRKKFLAMLLGLACALGCAFGFTACGGDNTGDGGDKTEQSTPTEKPDGNKTDGDKTGDDNKKPDDSDKDDNKTDDKTEQGGDKTDDDKTGDDKKPDDSDGDKTKPENPDEVKPNKYAEIVTALETEIGKTYTNPQILFIYEYNNYLACKVKTETTVYSIRTRVSTDGHSLTAENIDKSYYTENISGTRLTQLNAVQKGIYITDGTDDDKQLIESMIAKLLDDSYSVMYGTISTAQSKGDDAVLGTYAQFTVYALLEKDGSVFEYRETLSVSKDYNSGNVYQTVLGSTEANKADRYRSESKELTDLGEVAANYIAEEKRVAAATE